MILNFLLKVKNKLLYFYKKIFTYPDLKYTKNDKYKYWQRRKRDPNSIKPNDFQIERAKILKKFIKQSKSLLFDIGSGDGSQLIAIKQICPKIKLVGSDRDEFACKLLKRNKINFHFIKDNESISKIISDSNPKFISIFEVLEHMYEPEEMILDLLKNKNIKLIFASVPNSGFITHRLRSLFGRFPLQWISTPNEHIRFWTFKDLNWWLNYLDIKSQAMIIPYKGIPLLNKVMPNLFAEGSFIIIKNK